MLLCISDDNKCFTLLQDLVSTDESVFRELVFRGRYGFRGLRFLIRGFSRAKRILGTSLDLGTADADTEAVL